MEVKQRSADIHDGSRLRLGRDTDECAQVVVPVEEVTERRIVTLRRAIPVLRVDLELGHTCRIKTVFEFLTRQPAEKRRKLLHLGGTECLQHGVAKFVGVANRVAAPDQVAGRLVAFPCGSGEEKVQAVPHAFEVTVRSVVGAVEPGGGSASGSFSKTFTGDSFISQPRTPFGRTSRTGGAQADASTNASMDSGSSMSR